MRGDVRPLWRFLIASSPPTNRGVKSAFDLLVLCPNLFLYMVVNLPSQLQHRFSDYGHEVLQDGLTIRGITKLEIETCVPTLARLIV